MVRGCRPGMKNLFEFWDLGFFFPASPGHGKKEKGPLLIIPKD